MRLGPSVRSFARTANNGWVRYFAAPAGRASLVDCSRVSARTDAYGGVGAFAATRIEKGGLVETGVVRRLPMDGSTCPFVFTWSEDRSVWASGSGVSVFYNGSLDGKANTEMTRFFDEDLFEIRALCDIEEGDELTHIYKSLEWRECFKELKALRDGASTVPPSGGKQPLPGGGDKNGLVDCSKLYAKRDEFGGVGAFASVPIQKGELVERGVVRRLPVDGNVCPYVFTWSEDRSVWASGSGCSVFYNASLDGSENTEMHRFFDQDRFEIYATRDIAQDEEVTHLYKSIEWRECFRDLKAIRDRSLPKVPSGKRGFSTTTRQFSTARSAVRDPLPSQRQSFTEYWTTDHAAPTLENMMLDSNAGDMDRLERPEILSALPSLQGKRVLELGAGIGRFSGILAQKCGEVVAVDFVKSSCVENQRANAGCKNLTVMHGDVTQLELEPNSFDLVFSNWLLMYLTDEEVNDFAANVLKWLRPGGHLFFRESCFHSSGDTLRRFNPTQYRDPLAYSQIFARSVSVDGSRFQLLATNCVESYAQLKGNVHQIYFRYTKLGQLGSDRRSRVLDTSQFSPAHCLRYEKIYGRNQIYTGGDVISQKLLEDCAPLLKPGGRVLDFGCGLGGTALHFATQREDIFVHGVESSGELNSLGMGRHIQRDPALRQRLSFELTPEFGIPENELRYPPNSFDVIIMREVLMYLEETDKPVLLQKLSRLLRPGGRLVVVDYCAGKPLADLQPEFASYLHKWGYHLSTPEEEHRLLQSYFDVVPADATDQFVRFMDEGLERIEEEFGPASPLRKLTSSLAEDDQETLRNQLSETVSSSMPGLPASAANHAADAAVAKLAEHHLFEQEQAKTCEADYEWAQGIWQLERKEALGGNLKWIFFSATKRDLSGVLKS